MLRIGSKNRLPNDKILSESIGFISNKILNDCKDKNVMVGFTSSIDSERYELIIEKIIDFVGRNLQNYNKSVNWGKENLDDKGIYEIHDKLNELKNESRITLIKVKSVNVYSNAIEILKCCDIIISVEQYGKSKYLDFENMIERLRENSLNINGIISFK